jgi:hypothetical protein
LQLQSRKIKLGASHQISVHSGIAVSEKKAIAVTLSHQDGHHSAVALLLKAALIQVSDYRLLGASGFISSKKGEHCCGGHLGRRAEPPDIFLEENHSMTISSKFSSY